MTGTLAVGFEEIGCDIVAGAGGSEVGTGGASCGGAVGSGVGGSTEGFASGTLPPPSEKHKIKFESLTPIFNKISGDRFYIKIISHVQRNYLIESPGSAEKNLSRSYYNCTCIDFKQRSARSNCRSIFN